MTSTARCGPTTWRGHAIMRLDLKTGKYELIDPFKFLPQGHEHAPYGMAADGKNNLYFMDFGEREHRPRRRQDRRRHDLSDADAEFAAAPHHARRSRPAVVRRIRRQQAGDVRHQGGDVQGMGRADALHLSVRRVSRQERRIVERRHGERSRAALRSAKRAVGRISAAAADQYPARLRRQLDRSGRRSGPATITAPKSCASNR